MDTKLEELLQNLRQAMYEALASSRDVAEAMAQLEQAGHCPTLLVDVSCVDETTQGEDGPLEDELVLNEFDQQFLRAIKVTNPV